MQNVKKTCVVFDFDGTLANSVPVLFEVVNELAPEYGYAPLKEEQMPALRMMSAKDFLSNELGLYLWQLPGFEKRSRKKCVERLDKITIFDGMKQVVKDLQKEGYKIGVLSSNAQETIQSVLDRSNIEVDFIYSGASVFGKSAVINTMLKEKKIKREELVYVGDETRDVDACKKAGVVMVAVDWGFNCKDVLEKMGVHVVSTPQTLCSKLLNYSSIGSSQLA